MVRIKVDKRSAEASGNAARAAPGQSGTARRKMSSVLRRVIARHAIASAAADQIVIVLYGAIVGGS
jgi:hypothetical protein